MRTLLACLLVAIASAAPSFAQDAAPPTPATDEAVDPWFSTFSIIAFDPETQELGVGVQSRAFGAGAAVPYAIPGVGAVATQASANRSYGPKAIALLQQGLSPEEVVKQITNDDEGRDTRQVAVIDTKGRSAVYTGKRVIDRNFDKSDPVHYGGYAGHVTGTNFSVQGNTLASEDVVKAMAEAYAKGQGSMAERLMDALDAGQSQGGDMRGMQSAGLLVVKPLPPGSRSTVERIVDVRVDDAANPFTELRRLMYMTLREPNRLTERSAELAKAGRFDEAIVMQQQAVAINPNQERMYYALAQRLAQAGRFEDAILALKDAVDRRPQLRQEAAADSIFAPLADWPQFKQLAGSR